MLAYGVCVLWTADTNALREDRIDDFFDHAETLYTLPGVSWRSVFGGGDLAPILSSSGHFRRQSDRVCL